MSTRLSTEMTWEKPSTRRFAPPGGKSSISLGNYSEPPPPPPQAPPAPAPAFAPGTKPAVQGSVEERISNGSKSSSKSPPAKAALSVAVPSPLGGRRVGLAVCQAASLKAATVAELDKLGAKTTVYDVMDPLQLPFATQCLVNNASADVVIVVGFLIKDAHWCSSEVAGSLVKTLLDLSLEAKVPVVNGLCFSGVMKSDAVKLAERLAWGAVNMNALSQAGADSCAVSFPSSSEAAANGTTPASTSRSVGSKSKRVSSVFKQQREIPRELSSLLLGLRTSLKNLGTTAIFQLARRFRQADSNKSGSVNFHEFQVCMRNAHMDWTEDELNNVYEHFDTSGSGGISYDEFIMGVRGEVSGRRAQLVLLVFQLADKNKDGVVSVGDVKDMYDASQHPDVLESKRTEEEVMEEFIGTFDGEVKDGKVTPEEWCRYYSMVSASIDSDDYFELMMRNAWHIPGGEGACANTTIKRVLATHADGRQTVEEVQDGPFFDNGDNEAMLESLRAQGLNVSNVDMFGTVDSTEVAAVEKPADIPRPSASAIDPKFLPFVRQGPGGNSTIVLG